MNKKSKKRARVVTDCSAHISPCRAKKTKHEASGGIFPVTFSSYADRQPRRSSRSSPAIDNNPQAKPGERRLCGMCAKRSRGSGHDRGSGEDKKESSSAKLPCAIAATRPRRRRIFYGCSAFVPRWFAIANRFASNCSGRTKPMLSSSLHSTLVLSAFVLHKINSGLDGRCTDKTGVSGTTRQVDKRAIGLHESTVFP